METLAGRILSSVRFGLVRLATALGEKLAALSGRQKPVQTDLDILLQSLQPKRISPLDRWFPPRQFLVRGLGKDSGRTTVLHFSQRLQVGISATLALGLACFFVTAATAAWSHHTADRLAHEIDDLRGVARTETQAAAQARALLGRLQPELTRSVAERDRATAAASAVGVTLADTLTDIDRLAVARARIEGERDQAVAERDEAVASNRQLLARLDTQTRDAIAQIENIIAATGLDLTRVSHNPVTERSSLPRGGPFVPWSGALPSDARAQTINTLRIDNIASGIDRLNALGGFLARVPLASPLAQIDIAAGFGFRLDPFSRMPAAHEGLDLASNYGATVFATAAGIVSFTGWKGEYGNTVEIDHGMGLSTRYAHLSRIAVKPGEAIALRQIVGTVGATGRATGAHLHYETRVDGVARNPVNFLRAARHVQ